MLANTYTFFVDEDILGWAAYEGTVETYQQAIRSGNKAFTIASGRSKILVSSAETSIDDSATVVPGSISQDDIHVVATVEQTVTRNAVVTGLGTAPVIIEHRAKGKGWKLTMPDGEKVKWEVRQAKKHWDLRNSKVVLASFDSSNFCRREPGYLKFHCPLDDYSKLLIIISWGLAAKVYLETTTHDSGMRSDISATGIAHLE